MNRNNIDDIVSTDYIINEYQQKLQARKESLMEEISKIDDALKGLQKFKPNVIASSSNGNSHSKNKKVSQDELRSLVDASGADIFLWGLDRIGEEATVAEVAEQVAFLDIDKVKNRESNELRQWLTVSANSLCNSRVLVKEDRKDRKGGKVFRRV